MLKPPLRYFATLVPLLVLLSLSTTALVRASEARLDVETLLAPALDRADTLPRLHSLLLSHKGEVVLERYFNGRRASDIANIKSASKSVLSALVGAALARGHLSSLDQPIGPFFPELLAGEDNVGKGGITLEDLLTMRAGLESTSNRNYGRWVLSEDWVAFALNQPLRSPPGSTMAYSTGNTHLLSAILAKATGMSTLAFAREALGEPLGFHLNAWPTDPQGIHFGGNDMEMTARQMLRFGELYLNEGRYRGRQVLPADWVRDSLQAHAESPRRYSAVSPAGATRHYGYGWWIGSMVGLPVAYAWGYGGQFILLVQDLELVVVTTSESLPGDGRRAHTRAVHQLVAEDIVRPIAEALGQGAFRRPE